MVSCAPGTVNIVEFGADTSAENNAEAIDKAIAAVAKGGTVVVPSGVFLSSTVHLKSNITLHLDEGATIKGVDDPGAYDSYIPTKDMSRYDSGAGTLNSNVSSDAAWNRALVLGVGVENVSITGPGGFDGSHVFDSTGEEHMRGPHTILFAESRNLRLEGFTVDCAANYATMGYEIENALYKDLRICQGWDGVHMRGAKNVVIEGCDLKTGDDCIAGGYWENVVVKNCRLNTSCNGFRLMQPVGSLEVFDTEIYGPGVYPHRTSGNHKTIFAMVVEPAAWGPAPGDVGTISIHDVAIRDLTEPVVVDLTHGAKGREIIMRNVVSTGIRGTATPLRSVDGVRFESEVVENCPVEQATPAE